MGRLGGYFCAGGVWLHGNSNAPGVFMWVTED